MFILVFSDQRSYSHLPDDPRMISLLGQECALFQTVSLYTFCEKPSYPISILIRSYLVTGSVASILMDDAKMGAIEEVLSMLMLTFRMPNYMITDAATQFRGLQENAELINALSSCDIQINVVPQGHQF